MATVNLFRYFFNLGEPIPPGGTQGFWSGPSPLYLDSAITVTAHAFSGGIRQLEIVQMETQVNNLNGERFVNYTVRNNGTTPIDGLTACIGVISE